MSPKSCKNEYPPHICVLDEGHAGPHQAFRSCKFGGAPMLMAEWHGGSCVAVERSLDPSRAAGMKVITEESVPRDTIYAVKLSGWGEDKAIQAEIERVTKEIQVGFEKMAFEGAEGLAAHMPSSPGTLFNINRAGPEQRLSSSTPGFFGLDRSEPRCCFPDCKAVITFENHLIDNTQDIHDRFGLEGAQLRVCKVCRDVHGKIAPRQPAIPGVTQHNARPGVRYTIVLESYEDQALIIAESIGNPGWGRMVRVDGRLLHLWNRRTNAPPGERPLTDDDLETIINQFDLQPMHFQPWTPYEEHEFIAETETLQRELFFSDPVLREHVGRAVDINPDLFMNEEHAAAFQKGLERAWDLAWRGRTVESIALARACDRCDVIVNNRREE